MIQTTGDIEVTNPELVICHLDEGATLNMELTADVGKGYVPSQANRPADAPIGLIPVDALYSPVRQVAYKVENTRVGQEFLDYDKLTLTIETDGTIAPEDALAYAARILQDQLQLFVHFDEGAVRPAAVPTGMPVSAVETPTDTNQLNRYLLKKVDELELQRAQRQLPEERQHHLHRRPGPENRSRDAAHPNFGRKSLNEIKEVLASMGLRRDGHPRLAAGEHRGNGEEARAGDARVGRSGRAQGADCIAIGELRETANAGRRASERPQARCETRPTSRDLLP